MASADKPIIVIKKKGGHGGHHGGAWKIAYADFVTAMMAFFMVMWLVNSSDSATKKAIASYFKRPGIFLSGSGTPLEMGSQGILPDAYAPNKSDKSDVAVESQDATIRGYQKGPKAKDNQRAVKGPEEHGVDHFTAGGNPVYDERFITKEQKNLKEIQFQVRKLLGSSPELQALLGAVDVKLDGEGLTIDIMDTKKASMFSSGSAQISESARDAFKKIASILKKVPNEIEILGHTDAKPFSSRPGSYSNWDLSADRANAARRVLEEEGVPGERIKSVVGRASTDLKNASDPLSEENRRITLKMKFKTTMDVDLSKDPNALDNIEELSKIEPTKKPELTESQQAAEQILAQTPASTSETSSGPKIEVVRKPTPKSDNILLPEPEEQESMSGREPQKDKIFSDFPVISPGAIGAGIQ